MNTADASALALILAIRCPAVFEAEVTQEAVDNAPARVKRAIAALEALFQKAPDGSEEERVLAGVLADLAEHARDLYGVNA